ncbi:MAG: site-2 protease family protein [Anaerolineae bacterium]|nr:site-2 protease family protein [Phycisphaerae bacterium]
MSNEWRSNDFLVVYWHFLVFWALACVALIPHELGHLIAATLVGFTPAMISFNGGRRIATLILHNLVCEIRTLPGNGFVVATREQPIGWRWRAMAFVAAGPLANLFIASICFWVLGWDQWWPERLHSVSPLHLFAGANLAMGLWALLIPMDVNTPIGPSTNDGKQLYRIIRGDVPDPRQLGLLHASASAIVANRRGDVPKEAELLTEAANRFNAHGVLCLPLSACHLRMGEDRSACLIVQAELDRHVALDLTRAHLLTHLAWANLLIGGELGISNADDAAAQAVTIAPWDPHVQSVAGAVLLMKGEPSAASKQFAVSYTGLDDPVSRAMSLCGMSACAMQLGQRSAANRYAHRARRLDPASRLLPWTQEASRPDLDGALIR